MAKKKSNAGNAYILSQLNSYKGFSMPKVNVKAKPKADASKKKVEPKKKVETKKSGPSMYDTKVRDQYGKPVVNKPSDSKKKPYGMASKTSDEKKVVKKVEAKKPEVKKPAAKPMSKEMLEKMTKFGSAYYLNTKTGKLEKNPDFKTTVKKIGDSKKEQSKKVKSKIESLKRPEIRKETIKPEVVVTPRKKSEPTVSQLWQEKTGTSWSEAKKQGLTDGTASSNIALMKKLKSGEINKSSLSKPKTETAPTPVTTTTPTPTPKPTPYAGSGMGAMERADREFEEQGFRRGGSVRKMRKNRMKKK